MPSLGHLWMLQRLMYISSFHSHENFSSSYCCNTYERGKQLSLPDKVERIRPEGIRSAHSGCQIKRPLLGEIE